MPTRGFARGLSRATGAFSSPDSFQGINSCPPRGFARGLARACSGDCTHNPSSLSALTVKLGGWTTPRALRPPRSTSRPAWLFPGTTLMVQNTNHATRAMPVAIYPYRDRGHSCGIAQSPKLSALAVKLRGLTAPRVSHRCQRIRATRATPLATSPYPDRGHR